MRYYRGKLLLLQMLRPLMRLRLLFLVSLFLWLAAACTAPPANSRNAEPTRAAAPAGCIRHDLQADEEAGGHALRKHIGRSDAELRERLERERNISGSSTYTDQQTAECAVGGALVQDKVKISRWANRDGGHANYVVDYDSPTPVGRTLNRGDDSPHSCNHAKVVLKWDGPGQYHVLTTYPECR
jgi:hypothetical protein